MQASLHGLRALRGSFFVDVVSSSGPVMGCPSPANGDYQRAC